jgi:ATP-dependent Lon protease
MTGELSLTGKVMPVGGIKEKILAARRSGADTIILPAANRRDFDELPQYVSEPLMH